jgi:predicted O-linked N-acetylglucosamine transferase (SPINDLY family)
VADAWPEYCAIATRLGNEPVLRARLRAEMRERMARSPVTDAARFTRLLEDAYRSAWVRA